MPDTGTAIEQYRCRLQMMGFATDGLEMIFQIIGILRLVEPAGFLAGNRQRHDLVAAKHIMIGIFRGNALGLGFGQGFGGFGSGQTGLFTGCLDLILIHRSRRNDRIEANRLQHLTACAGP